METLMKQTKLAGSSSNAKKFCKMSADQLPKSASQIKMIKEIIRCINYAAIKHRDARRQDEYQTPYINHLIDISYILVNEGAVSDISVIQAALLNSVMEETETSYYELHAEFGEDIANLVKELTSDKSIQKQERRQRLLDSVSRFSPRAKAVLLAKELNMLREYRRAPPAWSKEKLQEYYESSARLISKLRSTNSGIEKSLDTLFNERGITIA
ncbi:hypothetical protein BsWGS_25094 [Bradybaena similaris]